MAPANGSAKSRRQGPGHSRQPSKPVVPAIPLPHVKRQAKAAAAAAASVSAPAVDNSSSSPSASRPDKTPTAAKEEAPALGSGSDGGQVAESRSAVEVDTTSPASRDVAAATRDDAATSSFAGVDTNGSVRGPGSTVTVTAEPKTLDKQAQQAATAPASETPVIVNGAKAKSELRKNAADHPAASFRPPPAVSPTRYQMPRPFQPAGRPNIMLNGDMHHAPKQPMANNNGPSYMHQAHPSNGSVHFGSFHESSGSSPHTGAIAPPPGMSMPDGRQPYMPLGNGFPPPMPPYAGDVMPAGSFDNYGRPALYPPVDAYHPGNNFGPSTPHSFHDSQSSAQPEDNGVFNQFPPGGPRNGMGPGEDMPIPNHQGRMFGAPDYPRMMPNHGMPPHMMPRADDADGMVGYLQQQFGSPDLADCTLELRYSDDRAPPVRIPGHQIVICRSPALFRSLRNLRLQTNPSDRAMQLVLLETDSKWVRSDSFYMAVQRLYGLPLLPIPPPRNESTEAMSAGNFRERFDFSLSYAAAGHLLAWTPIVTRGCEVATHLLDWQTLEGALDFALEEYRDRGSHEIFKYGDGSRILLGAAVTFIVHNFPYNFSLDSSLPDPEDYRRLPPILGLHKKPTEETSADSDATEVAKDSSVRFGKNRRSQKLSGIRFGDLSLNEQPTGPKQEQPLSHAVLSRVLLNLPFTQLKMILESAGSGNVNGWANAEVRYRIIREAVVEREARRLRALEAVVAGTVPDAERLLRQLRSAEPQFLDEWNALGWQEEILPYGNADGPALGRKWSPVAEPQRAVVAEYP
jgi:hypothetical protein